MFKLAFLSLIIFFLACSPSRISKKESYLPSSKRSGIHYSVKQGDSLWKISKLYNVSVERIMQENNISSPYNLKVGQKIFIPRYQSTTSKGFLWPIKGNIVNYFNDSVDSSLNRGVNIQATSEDRGVQASTQGKVAFSNPLKGWGKTIILKHDLGLYTVYANLDETLVKEGDTVSKGEAIGTVASGKNGSYVLHFEVRKKNIPKDPLEYLN
ncbi:MAG: LysM peptidoglycan-binding domain-containing M23 family metallopeptidase [Candidatus Omnitrophica bacterium]|nr:LysM peptidoglycan-binding domain-containing M23 family metallopeptidase [Candidatus Omnitrophota bacterium]